MRLAVLVRSSPEPSGAHMEPEASIISAVSGCSDDGSALLASGACIPMRVHAVVNAATPTRMRPGPV